eukprot:526750-Prorocentrum_minimum.AAC.1
MAPIFYGSFPRTVNSLLGLTVRSSPTNPRTFDAMLHEQVATKRRRRGGGGGGGGAGGRTPGGAGVAGAANT